MTDSTSTGNAEWWFWIIWIACVLWLVYWVFWWEREGYVNNIDNCQQEITIKDEFYNRIFRRFICEYNKTDDNKIIYGTCYHANFDRDWNCTKLITYEKDADISCPDWQYLDDYWACQCYSSSQYATSNGCYNKCWLGSSYNINDEKCYCDEWYIAENDKCVSIQSKCSQGSSYNVNDNKCYCDEGYIIENGKCVSTENKCWQNGRYNVVQSKCICDEWYVAESNGCVVISSTE